MTKLSKTPLVHKTSVLKECSLGRYTEIDERCRLNEVALGDYSYVMQDCEIWAAEIGKFVNIASHVRINATNHPMWRASQHHFTYRAADYFEGEGVEEDFFNWRREDKVIIGHDVWIGHGAIILPGVQIGDGAVIGAGAVVSKNVGAYEIVAGVPARFIKRRFNGEISTRLQALSWWDWTHERLQKALDDFRHLSIENFLQKHEENQL